ncbi:hypothetical protein [Alloalcanivorax gelatiniphagus]|uniref:Uncharacterized protein n=1 Tax=Alloalcanivorax gelatiniphagus TaxID=1194167 RepID=A0ABY2XML4_9GAMM|nr:hypothetical protein [Alloalcanivorax gelatiniphagus]TMW13079.1 hypothetical protein FGS76_08420 [Alloalcanivorax gelatiniphagus]
METGAWIAKQADTYNRQLHKAELKLIADHYKEYAVERGISDEQALKELLYQAQSQVDSAYAEDGGQRDLAILSGYDQQAAGDFFSGLAEHSGAISHDDGEVTAPFEATAEQYDNSYVNATHLHDIEDGAYGEQLFGYATPILTNMESDIGAGKYLDVIGQARLNASEAMFSQGTTVLGGALLTPAAASIGSAATVQVPFWGGVGAQTASTGARALGARMIVNVTAAEESMAVGALRANIALTDMVYGTGAAAETYVLVSSTLGFFDGYYGVVPGPPAYVPDGLPSHPVLAPYKASQELGAMLRDSFRFYEEGIND